MISSDPARARNVRCSRLAVCALSLLTFGSFAAPCNAQPTADVATQARALFDEGRALLERKAYADACPKFAESQRLDPGGGTLLNLALCHELIGRTASAWAEFNEGLRIARRDQRADRVEFAEKHLAALEPKLSRLRIIVPPEARIAELRIQRNGVDVEPATWGDALPVDPGPQLLAVSAPGKLGAQPTVDVAGEGKTIEFRVPALADATRAATPGSREPPVAPRPIPPPPAHASSTAHDAGTSRWLGGVVAVTGIAALGVATYLTIHALELKHDANEECCSADAVQTSRTAVHYANAATGVSIAGSILTGVGAYLFFKSPESHGARQSHALQPPRKPQAGIDLSPTGINAHLGGEF